MDVNEAYQKAKFLSSRDGNVIYVLLDDESYAVANDFQMDTYYAGIKPIAAFVNGILD